MHKYILYAANGGSRKTYDNVSDIQIVSDHTIQVNGSINPAFSCVPQGVQRGTRAMDQEGWTVLPPR